MTERSVVGNAADLQEGQVLLPSFVEHGPTGVFIDLSAIDSRDLVLQFIERVFGASAYFADLDYALFGKLLFEWEPRDIARQLEEFERRGKPPSLRLAADIRAFPPGRQEVYRGVKIVEGGKKAEYLFEPVTIERKRSDEEMATLGTEERTVAERVYLNADEFVAALWQKGVRFGLDMKAVREAIARDKTERLTVASMAPPTPGKDASVDEQTDLLHRDDSPRLRSDGRMDLQHFRNRFPQVTAGTRLFRKVPRQLGRSGWDVQGRALEPPAVNDFDIQTMAGPGTRVEREAGGECVVAVANGFLDIDAQSGQISVTDKIINRDGVSMRTTGNLSLAGDEFEEHGEVQEKRVVEGHNMTFLAAVYGNIVSDGGCITLKTKLGGGSAVSPGGTIVVEGTASSATIDARGGEVVVNHAEGSLILGKQVTVENAVRCEIVAETVEIKRAEGCAIAAKQVHIEHATTRRGEATQVNLLLPDLSRFERELARIEAGRQEDVAEIELKETLARDLTAQPDMKTYLAVQGQIKAGTLKLSAAQQVQWQALIARLAPMLRQLAALNQAMTEARQRLADADGECAAVERARGEAQASASCRIDEVGDDTLVRTLTLPFDAPPMENLPHKDLHLKLREGGDAATSVFAGSGGSFIWPPAPAEESVVPAA